jgi:hypothetical protein
MQNLVIGVWHHCADRVKSREGILAAQSFQEIEPWGARRQIHCQKVGEERVDP